MGHIKERKLQGGGVRYQGEIRLKGAPTITATFDRKTDAKAWIQKTEADLRAGRHQLYGEGIRSLSSLLADGDLKILACCKKLIAEVQGYCWDPKAAERGEDAPLKRFDHAIDSLRYGVFSYFGNKVSLKRLGVPAVDVDGRTLGHQAMGGGVGMVPQHYGGRRSIFG